MSKASILNIILSFLVVGGSLGGVLLGSFLERSNESLKWRRERCLEAYSEIFRSCVIVTEEADKIYGIECGSLEHNKQSEVVLEKVFEMYRLVDKAVLLAPQEVYEKLQHLTGYCGKEIGAKSVLCPKLSKSEWHKILVHDFAYLFMDALIAARNDLGLFSELYKNAGLDFINKSFDEVEEELSKGIINTEQAKLRLQEIKMKLDSM